MKVLEIKKDEKFYDAIQSMLSINAGSRQLILETGKIINVDVVWLGELYSLVYTPTRN